MPQSRSENKLGDQQYLTALLRLRVGRHGQTIRGEVRNIDGRSRRSFAGWSELVPAIRAWLASQSQDEPSGTGQSDVLH